MRKSQARTMMLKGCPSLLPQNQRWQPRVKVMEGTEHNIVALLYFFTSNEGYVIYLTLYIAKKMLETLSSSKQKSSSNLKNVSSAQPCLEFSI